MTIVDLIGWAAAAVSTSIALPQGLRIASTRSVAGISTLTWQTMLIAGLAWTAHGVLYGTQQIIWPNILLAITAGWVLWQLTTARKLPVIRTWGIPIVVAALAFAADYMLGPLVYGIIMFIPGALGQSAQLREIVRANDVRGVSLISQCAGLLTHILWASFAIPSGEIAVASVAVPMALLVAATVIALLIRRHVLAVRPAVAGNAAVPTASADPASPTVSVTLADPAPPTVLAGQEHIVGNEAIAGQAEKTGPGNVINV